MIQKINIGKFLLPIFMLINFIIYYFSYDGAIFIEGADATQYYKPALSFIDSREFMTGPFAPLTFGPPLYSIFLALPISIFGLEGSSEAIIILQATILFLTGYVFKLILLSLYSGTSRIFFSSLLHALIVLNPNSLITAHLCQSETLFTLLFSLALLFSVKLLNNFTFRNLIFIGIFAGLSALTRSVGLYFVIMLPFFLYVMMKFRGNKNKSMNFKFIIPILVGIIVISPWYIRNYIKFDKIFYTSNTGIYLQLQYIQLKNKGSGWSRESGENHYFEQFEEYSRKANNKKYKFCIDNNRHWSCNDVFTQLSLRLILNEPILVHIKTIFDSWANLFLSGGASNIRNYLGIEGKSDIVGFQANSYQGIDSIENFLKKINLPYLLILIVTMLFSLTTRVIGIFGLYYLIKNRTWRPYGVFLIGILLLFTAAYLYLGQSRFRVPLEPILMLFTVFGIIYLMRKGDKYK